MRRSGANLVMAACVALAAPAPLLAQQQVRIVGTTTADSVLLKDTLQTIAEFAFARDGCRDIGTVAVKTLPDYVPANTTYRTEDAFAYERWDVDLCGKSEALLISFADDPQGGTIFKIGYPPPGDLPAADPLD